MAIRINRLTVNAIVLGKLKFFGRQGGLWNRVPRLKIAQVLPAGIRLYLCSLPTASPSRLRF